VLLARTPSRRARRSDLQDDDVSSSEVDGVKFYIHRADTPRSHRLIFHDNAAAVVENERFRGRTTLLQRAYGFSQRASQMPLMLAPSWGQFKDRTYVTFYASALGRVESAPRWLAEIQRPSEDVCFWRLTDRSATLDLRTFDADPKVYYDAASRWDDAFQRSRLSFANSAGSTGLADEIALERNPARGVTRGLSYSAWDELLSDGQRSFIEQPPVHSIKLHGAAGTGKTLALEMKAIREVRRAREAGQEPRILFTTHSWAMAQKIDQELHQLDEWGTTTAIDVMPVLSMAEYTLPQDSWASDLRLIGEDSMSGKEYQLARISSLVEEFVAGDWLTFKDNASEGFAHRLESPNVNERSALVWDLLVEFGCVLGAEGIFPGINAERRYLSLGRAPWMMPLAALGDKRAVLYLYEKYVRELVADGLVTNDHVVNDFLSYLETFSWSGRRARNGYDLIFVDELHLFNAQERMVLRFLARNADQYPRLFMALDPRQSPWELYTFSKSERPAESDDAADIGIVDAVTLTTIHRYTPQILALVQHIHRDFPALELGQDWEIDISLAVSSNENGPLPIVSTCGSAAAEVIEVFDRASKPLANKGRTAIAIVDERRFAEFRVVAETRAARGVQSVSVISSREEVDNLQYSQSSLIVAPAEYMAGLQVDRIVIAGFPHTQTFGANLGHARRRFLSSLYLAVSRATTVVEIVCSEDYGGVPEVLEHAVQRGLAQLTKGRVA